MVARWIKKNRTVRINKNGYHLDRDFLYRIFEEGKTYDFCYEDLLYLKKKFLPVFKTYERVKDILGDFIEHGSNKSVYNHKSEDNKVVKVYYSETSMRKEMRNYAQLVGDNLENILAPTIFYEGYAVQEKVNYFNRDYDYCKVVDACLIDDNAHNSGIIGNRCCILDFEQIDFDFIYNNYEDIQQACKYGEMSLLALEKLENDYKR